MENSRWRFSEAIQKVKLLLEKGESCLIVGLPGSGKSTFASQFPDFPPIYTDKYGREDGDNWVLDVSKIPKGKLLYEGQGTGIEDLYKRENIKHLLYMRPSADLFRKAHAAKARDYQGDNPTFKQWFEEMSDLPDDQIKAMIDENQAEFIHFIKPTSLIIIDNDSLRGQVKVGWHEQT